MRQLCFSLLALSSMAFAQDGQQAIDDVRQTLLDEVSGSDDRSSALDRLRRNSPTPAQAWWQSGFVQTDDTWLPYQEAIRQNTASDIQKDYENRRTAERGKSIAGAHLRLARWCRKNGRHDQYRAHGLAAIDANSSLGTDPTLRSMGFVKLGGQWLSPESVHRLILERAAVEDSLARWGKELVEIRDGLKGSAKERDNAEKRLSEIRSADAVAAIEAVLGQTDREREAVSALANIPSARSSLLLAQHAVFSPAITIRRAATDALLSLIHI